jgi:uncharacterized delta-60 repeat protein
MSQIKKEDIMRCNNLCKVIITVLLPVVLLAQIQNWVYTYNGPENRDDHANSIVYGADGNVYAAGYSAESNIYSDFTVLSLDTLGGINWTYAYNGSGDQNDGAYSIVYGADGNIYAAGYCRNANNDFLVISLKPDGDENWVYFYNGTGNSIDCAYSIIYGSDGNIYAAGSSTGSGTSSDFTIISLGTTGDENWVYTYNGPGNSRDVAYSIAYGSDGNIYAAGSSTGSGTSSDFTIISLGTTGDENWVYRYNGVGNLTDYAYSIAYKDDGNLYAAGYINVTPMNTDFTVISLDTTGYENWIYTYEGSGNSHDKAHSVICGGDGNIYAVGHSTGSADNTDFTVVSLDTTGYENWVYRYNSSANLDDDAYSIIYAENGKLYAAGGAYDDPGSADDAGDFTVISLTTTGTSEWVYTHNGQADTTDAAMSIIYGENGKLYAAGFTTDTAGTRSNITVVSLTPRVADVKPVSIDIDSPIPEGTELYPEATVTNLGTNTESFVVTCEISPGDYSRNRSVNDLAPGDSVSVTFLQLFTFDPGIYTVTVYTRLADDENPANDTVTKVIETYVPGVADGYEGTPEKFSFNAPTINKGNTNIKLALALPKATKVDLLVYDVLGRVSEKIVSDRLPAGYHDVNVHLDLPAGVYFYNLKTGSGENIVTKFILLE